jgi:hypothetical protein
MKLRKSYVMPKGMVVETMGLPNIDRMSNTCKCLGHLLNYFGDD